MIGEKYNVDALKNRANTLLCTDVKDGSFTGSAIFLKLSNY